jgi:cell division protease FtsH
MITRWGYSKELGTVAYGDNQEEVFLGHSVARHQNISEATSQKIDSEIRRLIDEAYEKAKQILTDERDDLEALAQGLLEYETLTGDEIRDLLKGIPPARDPTEPPPSEKKGSSVPVTKPRPSGGEKGTGGIEPEPQPQA